MHGKLKLLHPTHVVQKTKLQTKYPFNGSKTQCAANSVADTLLTTKLHSCLQEPEKMTAFIGTTELTAGVFANKKRRIDALISALISASIKNGPTERSTKVSSLLRGSSSRLTHTLLLYGQSINHCQSVSDSEDR